MLPANWTKYTTEDGKDYYHNHVTNQTQWDFPMQLSDQPGKPLQLSLSAESKPVAGSPQYALF